MQHGQENSKTSQLHQNIDQVDSLRDNSELVSDDSFEVLSLDNPEFISSLNDQKNMEDEIVQNKKQYDEPSPNQQSDKGVKMINFKTQDALQDDQITKEFSEISFSSSSSSFLSEEINGINPSSPIDENIMKKQELLIQRKIQSPCNKINKKKNTFIISSREDLDVSQYFTSIQKDEMTESNILGSIIYQQKESLILKTEQVDKKNPNNQQNKKRISKLDQFLVGYKESCVPSYFDVPISCDFLNDLSILTRDVYILKSIYKKNFYLYCQQKIKCTKQLSEFFCWSDSPLKNPILQKLNYTDIQIWRKCIQDIFQYTQATSKQSQYTNVQDIVQTMLNHTQLNDEIYVFILKQIVGSSIQIQLQHCQLLIAITTSVTPSQEALFNIIEFLYNGIQQYKSSSSMKNLAFNIRIQSLEVVQLLQCALFRLVKTIGKKRLSPPSNQELELTFMQRQILVPLFLYQDNIDYFSIEPHCTERQFIDLVTKRYEIEHLKGFVGIINIIDGYGKFLDEQILIVDFLKQHQDLKFKHRCYLALRIKIYYDYEESDEDSNCLNYMNATDNYSNGAYSLSQQDFNNLNRLKTYVDSEQKTNISIQQGDTDIHTQMQYRITRQQARISFFEKLRTQVNYYWYNVQLQESYKTWIFECQTTDNSSDTQLKNIICAIKPIQIIFYCKLEGSQFMLNYMDIILWNIQRNVLTLCTTQAGNFDLYFKSQHESQSCEQIMQAYFKRALLR